MKKNILNPDIQKFINTNINSNLSQLILKGTPFNTVSIQDIVEQIEAKNKCKYKLPSWFETATIYYPNKLNIAQSSSEIAASYKAKLISGNSIIDLSGGFGVDCYYFSKAFKNVIHCELNPNLQPIAQYNFKLLKVPNIKSMQNDGLEVLTQLDQKFDWIYIDPSRRHDVKGKVFYLSDCVPHVPKHLEQLFKYSQNILIKASPMLDISIGLKELKHTKALHIVAINNEVKELLFVLEKGYKAEVNIVTVNLKKNTTQKFNFLLHAESKAISNYSVPKAYLYEPNAALMKAGPFKLISENFSVYKLHKHTHLYTSDVLMTFPGRRFVVKETLSYNKKILKSKLSNQKLNISTRNFPDSVAQLKKQFKIKDGGHLYVFFTTDQDQNKIVIICEKA
ncbi:MAG: class I SAM-dependent methyltransferase [Flavobacteriaceae bacterium]|nr:class I SAM-dependent methyltransferase [Flavobacteriaceae bacterium]